MIYILIDVKKPPLFPGKSKFRKNTWQSLTTSASGEKVKITLEHCRSALNSGKSPVWKILGFVLLDNRRTKYYRTENVGSGEWGVRSEPGDGAKYRERLENFSPMYTWRLKRGVRCGVAAVAALKLRKLVLEEKA